MMEHKALLIQQMRRAVEASKDGFILEHDDALATFGRYCAEHRIDVRQAWQWGRAYVEDAPECWDSAGMPLDH